jgi:hypothetical protein
MKLFRKEIIGDKIRSRYDVSGEVEHYCKKLFSDSIFSSNTVSIKFEPEEMSPHILEFVHNYDEFKKSTEGIKISSVLFVGDYANSSFSIVLDYGLSLLNILTDSEDVTKSLVERIDS